MIRKSKPNDLPSILAITERTGVFSKQEVATVTELFQGFLTSPRKSGYNFLSYIRKNDLLGYVCWGPTPLSYGTVDLYWICADPSQQGKGVAARLFKAVEKAALKRGKWMIVIWTSSKPEYKRARRFYEKMGCTLEAQIKDFYDRGDDLCIYIRRLVNP
ncbi:MAG TPA: GNAT family N-acetyltransferase [Anaerolineaceae bacterium]